jgi:hypothetical protein
MKTQSVLVLFAAAIVAGAAGAQAGVITVKTSKGERLALVGNPPAAAVAAKAGLHAGCPAMIEKSVVRVHAVDPKGHSLEKQAGVEAPMPGCKVKLQRDGAAKESGLVMEHR